MLIDFEVENFRSYREPKLFSMVASSAKELPENLIQLPDLDMALVRTAALYGPNASGKSNLLLAMNCVSDLMEFPLNRGLTRRTYLPKFALDRTSVTAPSKFRVRFLVEGTLFEYSITIRSEIVEEERLIAYPHGRPQEWFHRKGTETTFNSTYLKGQKQALRSVTPPDAPLLAVGAMFRHPQLTPPAQWLAINLGDRSSSSELPSRLGRRRGGGTELTTRRCHEDKLFRSWVNVFLRHADVGIQGVEVELTEEKSKRPVGRLGPDGQVVVSEQEVVQEHHEPYFIHTGDEITARFRLTDESQGTRRLFAMLVPVYEGLLNGHLIVIDELSSSLHPSLVREIIRSFHDQRLNPKNAQLVFATHDTSLLSGSLFRRDQVWFTEKNAVGATDLYSLHDVRGVRENDSFENGYIRGRYGAIPFFGKFDFPPVPEEASETTV